MIYIYQKIVTEALDNFETIRDGTDNLEIAEAAQHGIDQINKMRGPV